MKKKLIIITISMVICFTFAMLSVDNVLAMTEMEIANKQYELTSQIETLRLQIAELEIELINAENKTEIQNQIDQLELQIANLEEEREKLQGTKVDNLYYRILNEEQKTVEVIRHNDNKILTNVNIPSQVKINGQNYKVTTIGGYAFSSCENDQAFYQCENLTSITIPKSVQRIAQQHTRKQNYQQERLITSK